MTDSSSKYDDDGEYTDERYDYNNIGNINNNICYWNIIPNEILDEILQFACFVSYKTWCAVNRVCKKWRELTPIWIFFHSCALYSGFKFLSNIGDHKPILCSPYTLGFTVSDSTKHLENLWNLLMKHNVLSPDPKQAHISPCSTYADKEMLYAKQDDIYGRDGIDYNEYDDDVRLGGLRFIFNLKLWLEPLGYNMPYFVHYISGLHCNFPRLGHDRHCKLCISETSDWRGVAMANLLAHMTHTQQIYYRSMLYRMKFYIDIDNMLIFEIRYHSDEFFLETGHEIWLLFLRMRRFLRMHGIDCTMDVEDTYIDASKSIRYIRIRVPTARVSLSDETSIKNIFSMLDEDNPLLEEYTSLSLPITPRGWINTLVHRQILALRMHNIFDDRPILKLLKMNNNNSYIDDILSSVVDIVRKELSTYTPARYVDDVHGPDREDRITKYIERVKSRIHKTIEWFMLKDFKRSASIVEEPNLEQEVRFWLTLHAQANIHGFSLF